MEHPEGYLVALMSSVGEKEGTCAPEGRYLGKCVTLVSNAQLALGDVSVHCRERMTCQEKHAEAQPETLNSIKLHRNSVRSQQAVGLCLRTIEGSLMLRCTSTH